MNVHKLVQIAHVSDLHYLARGTMDASSPNTASWRALLKQLLPAHLSHLLEQGLSSHDPAALSAFKDSLELACREGEPWPRTLLVATGDLSTNGDWPSVRATMDELLEAARRAKIQERDVFFIYGNHDVWAGQLPFFSTQEELDQHRTLLRSSPPFDRTWPLGPMARGAEWSLWSLNTILHGRMENTLALGSVGDDRAWESQPGPDQLFALRERATAPEIRIVLTHHPVDGDGSPPFIRVLQNREEVGHSLGLPVDGSSTWPLVRLVLSGHTHRLYPRLGEMPEQAPPPGSATREGEPAPGKSLAEHQLQLTVGTLCQRQVHATAEPNCWQLLRLFTLEDPSTQTRQLVVERIVYRRGANGRFMPPPAPGSKSRAGVEWTTFDLTASHHSRSE